MTAPGCLTCASLSGERPISPFAPVLVTDKWQVEHLLPTAIAGWLVVVLRRHAAALHDLTAEEHRDLGAVLARIVPGLRAETGCEKEYVMQFAEAPGHGHVHVHVVAKPHDLPAELVGPAIFSAASTRPPVPEAEIASLCDRLRAVV